MHTYTNTKHSLNRETHRPEHYTYTHTHTLPIPTLYSQVQAPSSPEGQSTPDPGDGSLYSGVETSRRFLVLQQQQQSPTGQIPTRRPAPPPSPPQMSNRAGVSEDPIPHSACSYLVLVHAVLRCIYNRRGALCQRPSAR